MLRPSLPRAFFVASLLQALAAELPAQRLPTPALNSRRYSSASGEVALLVDPSDRQGRGAAKYRLEKSGKELWSGEKPYTLHEAVVANDGAAAGYAYTRGIEGFAKEGGRRAGNGAFELVILDPAGHERLDESIERKDSRFLHADPTPEAAGLLIVAESDRVIFRVRDPDVNRSRESWWSYVLSTGASLGRSEPQSLMPRGEAARFSIDARPVAGTPLTLVHWWRYEYANRQSLVGAWFTLVDADGRTVWSLEWPDDYNVPGDETREQALRDSIRNTGAILAATEPGRFDLRCVRSGERVAFGVTRGQTTESAWVVSEISRRPYADPVEKHDSLPEIPERLLDHLGTIELEHAQAAGATAANAVHDVLTFDFDDRGRAGFIRRDSENAFSFVVVEQSGKLIRELPLSSVQLPEKSTPACLWLERDAWLVHAAPPSGDRVKEVAWRVDASAGTLDALSAFDCPRIADADGRRDGGFVALVWPGVNIEKQVIAFDRDGRREWAITENYNGGPAALFAPEAVAVTARGEVVVLGNIRNTVQLFDRKGAYLKTIELAKTWGRKPNYLAGIAADSSGGFLVEDFLGSPPLVWMDGEGRVRLEAAPKMPDGRVVALRRFKLSPDDRIWGSDGSSILRLDSKGVVDLALGSAPDTQALGKVAGLAVDRRGGIYAVDERTGAVHVFDSSGKRVRSCVPDVDDFKGRLGSPTIAVREDGSLFVGGGDMGPGCIEFSADGRRAGRKRFDLDRVTESWYTKPGSDQFWVVGYEDVFLVDGSGKVLRRIERCADGRWLEHPDKASVAPDGSIAVAEHPGFGRRGSGRGEAWSVHVFSPAGEPVRTNLLPTGVIVSSLAYDGRRIAAACDVGVLILAADGSSLFRFRPRELERKGGARWCFFSSGGAELWLADADATQVHRFRLP